MNSLHGIVACAGDGSRFAASLGKAFPYPKHLESLGDKSILSHAVNGLLENFSIDRLTFTLNPRLANLYIDYLRDLQNTYPDTPFTYAPAIEVEKGYLFTNIKATVREGIYDLTGNKVEFGNPAVVIALGDSVITKGDGKIHEDVNDYFPLITEGKSFAIFRDAETKGLMYWLTKASELREGEPDFRRSAQDYGLRWWNCNTREELLTAERELDYYPVENGMQRVNYQPRKEF